MEIWVMLIIGKYRESMMMAIEGGGSVVGLSVWTGT